MTDRSPTERGPNVDDLRRQLRSLGYLDAGVDRFVLGPARQTRRPAAIALLTSLRIGLLAAVLLGPAAAVGMGARIPGLVTGPRDAFVVALYLGVVFGFAAAIVALAATLLLASAGGTFVARRARRVALGGGAVVSVGCLLYLTLWWRMANPAPVWASPVWTAVALGVAVVISLLLGHAVTVMALAVIMARDQTAADLTPLRASAQPYWKTSLVAGVLAFGGAAALLLFTTRAEAERAAPPPPLTVVSSGARVRVVAIDGFDHSIFALLSAAGRTPALTAALSHARADLTAGDTTDPARTWTTIATGQPPEVHGVQALETRRVAGIEGTVQPTAPSTAGRVLQAATDLIRLTRPSLASGEERRVKTIWEVAADSGLRTVVVNWWATWPAPLQSTGTILTDRAVLRLERGGPLDAEIAPTELYEKLRGEWSGIRERARSRAATLTNLPGDAAIRAVVQRSAELDALQLEMAQSLTEPPADLVAVYLPGLDIAQHTLVGSGGSAASAAVLAARVDALREYYVFLDGLLQNAVKPAARDMVMLVTGPGRTAAPSAGVLALAGAAARGGSRLTAQPIDVMPTVLYALGLPYSRELAGRPLPELFDERYVATYPPREVSTYGAPSARLAPRSGQPLDAEMLERLRSLGYVR